MNPAPKILISYALEFLQFSKKKNFVWEIAEEPTI